MDFSRDSNPVLWHSHGRKERDVLEVLPDFRILRAVRLQDL